MRLLEDLIMAITVDTLKSGIGRILAVLEAEHASLTELDGKIGDGDLGITLLKAFRELDRIKGEFPDDLGQALMQAAGGVARVSSSSFGNLLATGLMTVAKETKGMTSAEWSNVSQYLDKAVAAMSARGKASLGDKTVLDAVSAAASVSAGLDDPAEIRSRVLPAVDAALDEFRGKPSKIGRARIFADRSIGLDDPGMVAFKVMLGAL
jgi:phosphoenolpyruvate---glycerone phosphotransferase subunit DhaL